MIWHPFSPLAKEEVLYVRKAKGAYLYLSDDRKILDLVSSWWVNTVGHGNKRVAKAIGKQAKKMEHVIFAGFTHKPAIQLAEKLRELLPDDQSKIFFSDNGSTATEVALKLAIQYWHNQGIERKKIIAIEGAYHGDTFGAMSVGDRSEVFHKPFDDYLFDVEFVPFPRDDPEKSIRIMKELASNDTAAFIYEPLVQGAAGMRMYSAEVLDKLMAIAKEKQIICIADEVMTGFGRTGKIFATDHLQEKPDMLCLSKGITGGFLPMGVTTVNYRVAAAFESREVEKTFFHGHSYTANPLACAAANESIKILREEETQKAIERISACHEAFVSRFKPTHHVADVRHTGTILAIELKATDGGYVSEWKEHIYQYFLEKDLLMRPLGNVMYLIPPYVITEEELMFVYDSIEQFFNELD